MKGKEENFPLTLMRILAPGSAQARPSAQPPFNVRKTEKTGKTMKNKESIRKYQAVSGIRWGWVTSKIKLTRPC